jgi:hypothetical protein
VESDDPDDRNPYLVTANDATNITEDLFILNPEDEVLTKESNSETTVAIAGDNFLPSPGIETMLCERKEKNMHRQRV